MPNDPKRPVQGVVADTGNSGGARRTRRTRGTRGSSTTLWVVTAGTGDRRLDYMTRTGVVVVGWSATGDVGELGSRPRLRTRLAQVYPDAGPDALDSWASQLWSFATQIRVGDEIAVPIEGRGELARGQVSGRYRYDRAAPENRRHQIPVDWSGRIAFDHSDAALEAAVASRLSVIALPDHPGLSADGKLSRRALLVGGGAALGVAAAAAVLRPWQGESSSAMQSTRAAARPPRPRPADKRVRSTPNGPVAQWVVDENAKPGTTNWNVSNGGPDGGIEGFANTVSTVQGSPVTLFVSTVDPSFHVEAYRLGWYGGKGGRLVWQSPVLAGVKQPDPVITPGTNMVEAPWKPSLQVPFGSKFPPGVYLLKLVASSGIQHLVPLTVRDDASTAAYLVQSSVTTWQAYNDWGGYSLYKGPDGSFARRARVVSFDRPYQEGAGSSSDLLGLEFPLIGLIEQLGLDVTYSTDIDTHAHPERLQRHRAYFSLGHDEYWSKEMRDGVEAARDAGVNLVFFGSNAAFRQIRLEPSPMGPNRHEVCYKDGSEDPIRATQPALTTVNWREAPVSRPESTMIGQQYESNPVRADMVIAEPDSWVFKGTGVVAGQRLSGTIGSEYDRFLPSQAGPPNVEIFAHSPVVCRGVASFADMTYYAAPSGAGVLAIGTIDWIPQLTPPGPGSPNDPIVVAATKNVLAVFGQHAAGATHPSTANYDAIARQFGSAPTGLSGTD